MTLVIPQWVKTINYTYGLCVLVFPVKTFCRKNVGQNFTRVATPIRRMNYLVSLSEISLWFSKITADRAQNAISSIVEFQTG